MLTYEKSVSFNRNGLMMFGVLHVPQKTSPQYPAVILLHGFTGHKAESHFMFTRLARSLARVGYVCLRFDFIGSGDSQGDFKDMTILTELEDARTALNFLVNLPEVDSQRIGLLGLSMGGCIAALLAAENSFITSLVLWSAVSNPEDQFQKYFSNLPKTYIDNQRWFIDNGGFAIGDEFFNVLPFINPLENIASFAGPVLVIHGRNDLAIPLAAAYDYYDVLNKRNGSDTELYIVENADHVFSSVPLTDKVIDKTITWFEKTLK